MSHSYHVDNQGGGGQSGQLPTFLDQTGQQNFLIVKLSVVINVSSNIFMNFSVSHKNFSRLALPPPR